ncbi:MAG: hypothetical protein V1719_00405, partial [Patescibacteria group bacterium]
MNTKAIQKIFPHVFQELFSNCQIIASAPGDFFWAGEHGILYGGLGVVQHIPLRSYMGLKPNSVNCFRLVGFKSYIPSRSQFENINFGIYDFSQMNELLTAEKNKITTKEIGFDIYGVSEIPISCGLNAIGASSAALAMAFFIALGELTHEEIKSWQNIPPSQLCKYATKFDRVFRLAWKINVILHGKACSTIRTFAPLVYSSLPIFSGSNRIHNQTNAAEGVDHTAYWAGGFAEIVNTKNIVNWPIDIAIIYSGEKRPTGFLANTTEETRVSLETVSQEIQSQIKNLSNATPDTPFLCNISMENMLWFNYWNAMFTISLEIFYALRQVFATATGGDNVGHLLRAIRKHNHGLRLMNLTSLWTQQVILAMKNYSRHHGQMTAGIKLIGGGQSGDILFVTPFNEMRDHITDMIEQIKHEDPTKPVHLDYASWQDGLEPEGAKLEQDLQKQIYSQWISTGTYRLVKLDQTGKLHHALISVEERNKIKKQAPILLDKTEKRIYICGQKLTSKELKSTSATIEIVDFLLPRAGQEVRNNHLPKSIYA